MFLNVFVGFILGDGGNDVSMIQAADAGIGIEGKVSCHLIGHFIGKYRFNQFFKLVIPGGAPSISSFRFLYYTV